MRMLRCPPRGVESGNGARARAARGGPAVAARRDCLYNFCRAPTTGRFCFLAPRFAMSAARATRDQAASGLSEPGAHPPAAAAHGVDPASHQRRGAVSRRAAAAARRTFSAVSPRRRAFDAIPRPPWPRRSAKIVLIGLIWAYLHHFCAGIRFLLLDMHKGIELKPARPVERRGAAWSSLAACDHRRGLAMVERIVVGAHYGLKDWLVQRITRSSWRSTPCSGWRSPGPRAASTTRCGGHCSPTARFGWPRCCSGWPALARLGGHARHLDGLCQADGTAPDGRGADRA